MSARHHFHVLPLTPRAHERGVGCWEMSGRLTLARADAMAEAIADAHGLDRLDVTLRAGRP